MASERNLHLRCLCGFIADTDEILVDHKNRHLWAAIRNPHAPAVTRNPSYTNEAREKSLKNWTSSLSSRGVPLVEESITNRNLGCRERKVPGHQVNRFEFLDSMSSSESDTEMDISSPVRNEDTALPDGNILEVLSVASSDGSSSDSSISDDSEDCTTGTLPGSSRATSPVPPSTPKNPRKRVMSLPKPGEPTNLMSKYLKLVASGIRNESCPTSSEDDATDSSDSYGDGDSDSD